MLTKAIKRTLRAFGLDITRYAPQWSQAALVNRLFASHQVDCVIDVGANSGQYAQWLRNRGYSGRIVSFEPLSSAHDLLVTNSRRDKEWIAAPRMALGAVDGKTEINIAANLVSSSILPMTDLHVRAAPESQYVAAEEVDIHRLDSVLPPYLNDVSHPFLKLDAQGYELQVLEGASSSLSRFVGVAAEMSLDELYQGQVLFIDFVSLMARESFQLAAVFPGLVDGRTGRFLQVDGLFFRGEAKA